MHRNRNILAPFSNSRFSAYSTPGESVQEAEASCSFEKLNSWRCKSLVLFLICSSFVIFSPPPLLFPLFVLLHSVAFYFSFFPKGTQSVPQVTGLPILRFTCRFHGLVRILQIWLQYCKVLAANIHLHIVRIDYILLAGKILLSLCFPRVKGNWGEGWHRSLSRVSAHSHERIGDTGLDLTL